MSIDESQLLDEVGVAVLNGQATRICAANNQLPRWSVGKLVNQYCGMTNATAFRELQTTPHIADLPLSVLRQHRQLFLLRTIATEPITRFSSIWRLPGVPTRTLGGLHAHKIDTIDELIKTPLSELKLMKNIGPYGIQKLLGALRSCGFAEPQH